MYAFSGLLSDFTVSHEVVNKLKSYRGTVERSKLILLLVSDLSPKGGNGESICMEEMHHVSARDRHSPFVHDL
jgi:hypothetical protein